MIFPVHAGRKPSGTRWFLLAATLIGGLVVSSFATAAPPIFATPDQADLIRAARSLQDGFEKDAFDKYHRAAKFGNKEAQKNIALMYIKGLGVEKNWARAYAWLRLASTHKDQRIVAARDEVYSALRDDERAVADEYFKTLHGEYGDLVALDRRHEWVRKQKREVTGSRLGKVGALRVQIADASGYNWELSGQQYFDVLDTYVLDFEQFVGEVEFGDLEILEEAAALPDSLQKPEDDGTATADPD